MRILFLWLDMDYQHCRRRKGKEKNAQSVTGQPYDELGMTAAGLFLRFISSVK